MAKAATVKTRCPQCQWRGEFIQVTPIRLRRCRNGHVWEDSKKPYQHQRVPLTVQLEQARRGNEDLRLLLRQAYHLLQDYHDCLSVPQRLKLGDFGLMRRIKEAAVDKPQPT